MADEEFDDNTKHEDEDVYNEENLEELEESDEISPEEGAFMEGYDKLEKDLEKKKKPKKKKTN